MTQDDPEGFTGKVEDSARAVALLKSLSHEGRLQILCILIDNELSVTEIAAALDTSPSSVSQQMMRLRAEGLVQTTRQGKSVIYRLAREELEPVLRTLRDTFCNPRNSGAEDR
ncbi:ArsR/SmtB family transcription factor [Phaeovulum sp.]|uniref:ArsR/SmtB family transcription factor n=1 Tax=Phaeovulum sp. TaxID=2934796 RepID=UPI003569EBD4